MGLIPSPTGIGSMASVAPRFSCNDNGVSKTYAMHDSWPRSSQGPAPECYESMPACLTRHAEHAKHEACDV